MKFNDVSTTEIDPFSRFIGRVETECEFAAHAIFRCDAIPFTIRVCQSIIKSFQDAGYDVEQVPIELQKRNTTKGRKAEMALGDGSHSKVSSGQERIEYTPVKKRRISARGLAAIRRAVKNRWKKAKQEQKIMKQIKDQRNATREVGKKRVKPKLTKEQAAKQRIYAARNVARAKGLPLPPLPAKKAA